MYRDRVEFDHVYVQGHALYKFVHVLVQGQARIQACPCTWTGPNSGMSLYMDRAEFEPENLLNIMIFILKKYFKHYEFML
jgi:hypothetical protein